EPCIIDALWRVFYRDVCTSRVDTHKERNGESEEIECRHFLSEVMFLTGRPPAGATAVTPKLHFNMNQVYSVLASQGMVPEGGGGLLFSLL
ncbi:hypothetical protein KUCAC02_007445, partial [Chaenocephalus aceratus]